MQTNIQNYNITATLFALLLTLSVGIGTVSADGPTWAAKPGWDAPDDVGNGSAPAFVDIDTDGDYDLFIGEQMGVSFAYENTGSATNPAWTKKSSWDLPGVNSGSKPAFADLDNDGDYDVLIGDGPTATAHAYENTGSASSPAWTANSGWDSPTLSWGGCKPALADLDNDGDYDLLLYAASNGNRAVYENTGGAGSPIWTANPSWNPPTMGQGATPDFADLDGDGDYDLMVGNTTGGATSAYENTGGASSPVWARKSSWDPPGVTAAAKPALADLDNDGDYDLLIGNQAGFSAGFENTAALATDCLGDCYAGADCTGDVLGTDMTCYACLAAGGQSWNVTADKCSGDLYCPNTCIDISSGCPVCCNGVDDDCDGLKDCADPGCACCCDYTETLEASVPCVPELASVFLLGNGLLVLAGCAGLRRRRRE